MYALDSPDHHPRQFGFPNNAGCPGKHALIEHPQLF